MPASTKKAPARAHPARPAPEASGRTAPKGGQAAGAKPTKPAPAAKGKASPAAKQATVPAAKKASAASGKKPAKPVRGTAAKPSPAAPAPAAKKAAPVTLKPAPAAKKPALPKPTAAAEKPAKAAPAAGKVSRPAAKPAPAKAKPAPKKPEAKAVAKPPKPKRAPSPFSIGDKVVYPHHGAAVIARKEKLLFDGQRTEYFVLEVATDQLILKVPVHKAVEQGVRPVISQNVARRVMATFKLPPEEAGANWSRWYKLLTEKINSGDIFQVAEVVRDLTYAQQTKGISPALKRMLSKARLILASELRFAFDVSEEEAMRRLDKSLPKVEVPEEF